MLRLLSSKAQERKRKNFEKTIWTLSCGYSLESSRWALSYEYPFARFSVIFQVFCILFLLAKLATSRIRVKILLRVCCMNLWHFWQLENSSQFMNYFYSIFLLNLQMLRLLSSKAQGCKDFWKPSKPCFVGIHWIALAEYSQMSTNMPGIKSF